jgi:hypothetical protein
MDPTPNESVGGELSPHASRLELRSATRSPAWYGSVCLGGHGTHLQIDSKTHPRWKEG